VLREAGLAEASREGRFRRYRLRPQGLTELRGWLDGIVHCRVLELEPPERISKLFRINL
jgi:DNA-binding transcriptional ArsR family regulator